MSAVRLLILYMFCMTVVLLEGTTTVRPTISPTRAPTRLPTRSPSRRPSRRPTSLPTSHPTARPTARPTADPTARPTSHPTAHPTSRPTSKATSEASPKPPSGSSDCWARINDRAWVDTRGNGHVQMGYLSSSNEDNWPIVSASGQPMMTAAKCRMACEGLGKSFCAAAQFFRCPQEDESWCNLLTPAEYEATKKSPVFIDSSEESGISAVAWRRVPCSLRD